MPRDEESMRDVGGDMTVREAGKRGGEATSETHGPEFYSDIGHKGGQRVRELVEEGKRTEGVQTDESEAY